MATAVCRVHRCPLKEKLNTHKTQVLRLHGDPRKALTWLLYLKTDVNKGISTTIFLEGSVSGSNNISRVTFKSTLSIDM